MPRFLAVELTLAGFDRVAVNRTRLLLYFQKHFSQTAFSRECRETDGGYRFSRSTGSDRSDLTVENENRPVASPLLLTGRASYKK